MKPSIALFVLSCFFAPILAFSASLTGIVRDGGTGEPLAAANVRVLGTSAGTITNEVGMFSLTMQPGIYRLRTSMLGYSPDTVTVEAPRLSPVEITLRPSAIVMPEVVVTSEDPAMEIIRRAIAAKRQWVNRLVSYTMEAFTRQVIKRDTAIASITESFTRGYWQQGDTLREIIQQRRQTQNVQAGFNWASVGRIINFNEDRIHLFGYIFVGPTADDALDYYDYHLLRTRNTEDREMYEIRMTPRGRTSPLFNGIVHIEGKTYALVGVDVQPNEAFQIPFVTEKEFRYRQQFALYEGAFWLPVDIRIEARAVISVFGLSIPPIAFSQTSVITDYGVNAAIPDSIFHKPRLSVDSVSVARVDSAFWKEQRVLPLNPAEAKAYKTLDSTQTLDVQFRPGGVTASIGGDVGPAALALNYLDANFNRVEGFRLGLHAEETHVLPILALRGGASYAFSSKMTVYNAGLTLFTNKSQKLGMGVDVYREASHTPNQGYYAPIANSLAALLGKEDYEDYFLNTGWQPFVETTPSRNLRLRLSYLIEEHRPLAKRTDFSIFYPSQKFRGNPSLGEHKFRSVKLEGRIGKERVPLDLLFQNGIDFSLEGMDNRAARYEAVASLAVPTGNAFLLNPGFLFRLAGGWSSGDLPLERYFSLESSLSGDGPFGVLKGADVKEFSGQGYIAFNSEYNFRSLPFLALGIPFLYENNLELIVHGAAARTWNKRPRVNSSQDAAISVWDQNIFPGNVTLGTYYEAGVGISRIFELFRADFTWRFANPAGLRFTLSTANIM
jgi:hypothetical protein